MAAGCKLLRPLLRFFRGLRLTLNALVRAPKQHLLSTHQRHC